MRRSPWPIHAPKTLRTALTDGWCGSSGIIGSGHDEVNACDQHVMASFDTTGRLC
jgi:hypothetical protein